jgi:hypothetical protein
MEQGCAVQILIGWIDDEQNHMDGFWAPVVGVSQTDTTRSITIWEDPTESDSARTATYSFYPVVDDNGWNWVPGFDDLPWKAHIESAIILCQDPDITFQAIGIDQQQAPADLRLSIHQNPAPWDREVQYSFVMDESGEAEVLVYTMQGQLVSGERLGGLSRGRQVQTLPIGMIKSPGIYLIGVRTAGGMEVTRLLRY